MIRVFSPKEDDEFEEFAAAYAENAKAELPIEFLKKSSVYCLLESHEGSDEKLIGGMVIRNRPPYRSLECIVDKSKHIELPGPVLELTGLFAIKRRRGLRTRSWLSFGCFLAILLSRQKYLLAVTTKQSLWQKTYQTLGAVAIYEGEVATDDKVKHGWVFLIERRRFFRRLPWYFVRRSLPSFCEFATQKAFVTNPTHHLRPSARQSK